MDRATIMQFKRDLIISTQRNVIKYLMDETDFRVAKSHIFGDMIRRYSQLDEGKIADIIGNVLFELLDNNAIKDTINNIIEEEEINGTIEELLEVEEYRLWEGAIK